MPTAEPTSDSCLSSDDPELLESLEMPDSEELLWLPLAVFPEEVEDPWTQLNLGAGSEEAQG